jgi:hypothetical protein
MRYGSGEKLFCVSWIIVTYFKSLFNKYTFTETNVRSVTEDLYEQLCTIIYRDDDNNMGLCFPL